MTHLNTTTLNTTTIEHIVDDFSFFENDEEKYTYVIDLGKKLPPMNPSLKDEDSLVDGCMSQVWLTCETNHINGKTVLSFQGDSDSIIARGLVGLVISLYNNKTADDVLKCDAMDMFQRIGFGNSISMNRRSGFSAMVAKIQHFAKTA